MKITIILFLLSFLVLTAMFLYRSNEPKIITVENTNMVVETKTETLDAPQLPNIEWTSEKLVTEPQREFGLYISYYGDTRRPWVDIKGTGMLYTKEVTVEADGVASPYHKTFEEFERALETNGWKRSPNIFNTNQWNIYIGSSADADGPFGFTHGYFKNIENQYRTVYYSSHLEMTRYSELEGVVCPCSRIHEVGISDIIDVDSSNF